MKNFIKGGLIVGGFLAGFALPVQLPLANAIPTDTTGQEWAAEQMNPMPWAPVPTPTPTPSESKPKPVKRNVKATTPKPTPSLSLWGHEPFDYDIPQNWQYTPPADPRCDIMHPTQNHDRYQKVHC